MTTINEDMKKNSPKLTGKYLVKLYANPDLGYCPNDEWICDDLKDAKSYALKYARFTMDAHIFECKLIEVVQVAKMVSIKLEDMVVETEEVEKQEE